jgi:hypothetical protein|tara:strand:- start:409 stop:720 length:312 start_codon:yes stop_codon:yes gene_type:complete
MSAAGNLLREAKALISDPKDWTQKGVYITPEGCLCSAGAINRAYNTSGVAPDVADKAYVIMNKSVSKVSRIHHVNSYNDDPKTTHTDIMKLFDDAAAMADEPT